MPAAGGGRRSRAGGLASVAFALLGGLAALGAGAVASFAAGPVPANVAVSVAVTTLAALAAGAARDARRPWDPHSPAAARAQACRTLGLLPDLAVHLTGRQARRTPRRGVLHGLPAAPTLRLASPGHRPARGLRPGRGHGPCPGQPQRAADRAATDAPTEAPAPVLLTVSEKLLMNAPETNPPLRATTPDALDTSEPNVARIYDYLLGGKDNFPADRELAEKLLAIYPNVRQMVRENRRFLVRALDYTLAQAISQYVDLGAGLPTTPAVHDVVHRQDNAATVLYVDNDPVVVNHLRASACTAGSRIEATRADLTRPAGILAHAREAALIDLDEPICLILTMVLHFMDPQTARDLVKTYVDELAPGSYVILTVARGEEAIGAQITRAYDAAIVHNHSHDDVVSFFAGLDLIPPGVCDARAWMPGWVTPAPFYDRAGQVLAGVAVKS